MTRDKLLASIDALLSLDEQKALVPHGIGGHARELLTEAKAHLSGSDQPSGWREALEKIRMELLPAKHTNWLSASGEKIMEIIDAGLAAKPEAREGEDDCYCGGGDISGHATECPERDASQPCGWSDISTAPKDGTKIIYHNGQKVDPVIGYCQWCYFNEDDYEDWWDYERDTEASPKFWMPAIPLPDAATPEAREGGE